jgi:hypothetical protein
MKEENRIFKTKKSEKIIYIYIYSLLIIKREIKKKYIYLKVTGNCFTAEAA